MSLVIQRCTTCGRTLFPDRVLCPECGGAQLSHETLEVGTVTDHTRTSEGHVLLTLEVDAGLRVIGRLLGAGAVTTGDVLPLVGHDDHPGPAAYVPRPDGGTTPSGSVVPADAHRLPEDPTLRSATVPGLLRARAELTPDAPLLRCGPVRRTAREMLDAVSRAGGALVERGIGRGDKVALMAANRVELLDLVLGAAWIGAVAVPINTAARGEQLHHVLTNSQARLLVIEPELLEAVQDLPPLPDLRERWVLENDTSVLGAAVEAADVRAGDPAAILYTSGTTGVSKGVVCPHGQFSWWGRNVSAQLGLRSDDVLHTCLPLFHTNALNAFSQAVVAGATYVLGGRFSASRFWSQMVESGATVTYLLGAMVSILDRRPPSPLDRAHRVRLALSPATPAALVGPFRERFGVELLDGYGSTETNAVLATPPGAQRPGYVGTVQPGFTARVVDEDGAPVPPGEPGELLVRSDQPFAFASGYFHMPEATAASWQDLWFHTGDRVVLEADGWVRFVDRIKDVIRRRGENISASEVESVLGQHPAVAAAAVYAVDSELGEDEVMAALVTEPDRELDVDDLVAFCRPRLAGYAIPRFIRVVDDLPLTENGKVRKPALRALGTDGAWDREADRDARAGSVAAQVVPS
ncbi:ATP-dependent acyl-CoA ligase [Nocardioides zeae]|uniref:AMP-binding protein n=1 Tax=Nocardioides zeae TaxID=1457234 RepID=A0A6P0HEJ3_9ACTN|nr:ATP-dependent acyl-CoA ligase [Nocardioides zeae]NEN77148.1 AMP-binding protein [Nocardioides zeae]